MEQEKKEEINIYERQIRNIRRFRKKIDDFEDLMYEVFS